MNLGKELIDPEEADGKLLQQARRGNEEAFVTLYRRHQQSVFRFAMAMSGLRETAEEVTQEVFLALLSPKTTYNERQGTLQGYLIGVARNQVRKHLFRGRPAPKETEETSRIPEPLDILTRAEEIEALRNAILSLPQAYREVIVLCELENIDYATAAEQLGCALGTVKSRLNRARAILGARLRKKERCPA